MRRVIFAAVLGLACSAAPAQASPDALRSWRLAVSQVRAAPRLHLDVTRSGSERIVVDHVADGGQQILRLLDGRVRSTSVILWAGRLAPGAAVDLRGYYTLRPAAACWTEYGYGSPYRVESSPFGDLVSSRERDAFKAPQLSSQQVRWAKKRMPAGTRKLVISRISDGVAVSGSMDVDSKTGRPIRLLTNGASRQMTSFSWQTDFQPAQPSPLCAA
jgi:hypothetical protein